MMHRALRRHGIVLAALCALFIPTIAVAADDVASRVLELTGSRTKIVWLHATDGKGDSWDATSPIYELMGFDTADGKIRTILPGPASYANPCISPDGQRVLFSDSPKNTLHSVNWDGTDKKELTKGYVLCTWKNPADGSQWVLFTDGGYMKGPLWRCRIDDPGVREMLWNKDQVAHTLSISADGTHVGTEFPWPNAGVGILPNKGWRQYGDGCNACIAPDNSYRFFHMGETVSHGGVMMYDAGGGEQTDAAIHGLSRSAAARGCLGAAMDQRCALPDDQCADRRPRGGHLPGRIQQRLHHC